MRLLIVEDKLKYAKLLVERLKPAGFDADIETTAAGAARATSKVAYSAIVLDLGLPDRDGMDFLRSFRGRGKTTPVLIVTARSGLDDRLSGLRAGADDFLSKPFSVDELIARLQALMRRPGRDYLDQTLRAGNVSLDTRNRQVNIGDQMHVVRLRETFILELLIRNLGSVVRRQDFEGQLFGDEDEPVSNTVEVYVHRLRRQLAEGGATVSIHTIRGVGYMMIEGKHPLEQSLAVTHC